jgi:fucose 4-O-acetylase-like acetyltransferase
VGGAVTGAVREKRIDALKGLAIACVVLYHVGGEYFRYTSDSGVVYEQWAVVLRALLFSFMLPLFAFMSGYVLGRPGAFRPSEYFARRTLGLLVPYFVWETIYGPGHDKHPEMFSSLSAFVGYYGHLLIDPHYEGRIWYLYVLWIALMVLGLVRLVGDRTVVLVLSVPVIYALGSFGQFHWLRWVYAFVVAGVLWRRHEADILPRIGALGVACAAAFVPAWLLFEPAVGMHAGLMVGTGTVLGSAAVAAALSFGAIVTGALAVVALVALSYRLPRRAEAVLAGLGVCSLGIYVSHFYLVEMWRGMPVWFLPVNVAVALVGAWAFTLLLRSWPPSAAVFLGGVGATRGSKPRADLQTEAT